MSRVARHCPVCNAIEPRILFRQEFAPTDATPVDGYDVVVCQRCGCGYADRIPDQDAFDQYYRAMSKYEYHQRAGAESEYDQRRLALTADIVGRHAPSRVVRIMDVGCATGRLLAELRARGFQNLVGLDPSPSCAAAAHRLYGIDVRTMTLAEFAEAGEAIDFIIMVGVLEHLENVDKAFQHLQKILRPGGFLYLDVPDATAFADWPNAPYQDFSTEHINFFAPVSLDNLFTQRGFSCVLREQNHREQSHATVMSNISAIYRRDSSEPIARLEYDHATAEGLERYIAQCAIGADHLQSQIDTLVESGRPILVWGVGTHTSRLMATSRLPEANIVAFVESNARYHGKSLAGRPIVAPGALKDHSEPVLISSRVFQHEIAEQIREDLGCANELVLLYKL